MSYIVSHHGTLYFQIRVPASLQSTHGKLIRVNLQTRDPAVARVLSLRLASDWLSRFQTESILQPELVGVSCNDEKGPPEPGSQADPLRSEKNPTAKREPGRAVEVLTDRELFDAWSRIDATRASSTLGDMQAAIKSFRATCKKPWSALERIDISAFRDHLISKRLARATVAKRIGLISTLLQVGFDAGLLEQNVARGLKVPRAEVPTIERRPFTDLELERIFSSPVFTRRLRPLAGCGAACVWMPMLAYVTGARLEEIAQLLLADIVIDETFGPVVRITDQGESQRLKTIGSRRMVPLHVDIVRAGFIEYVEAVREANHRWLFPELMPDHDGRRGGNFGKWWQRYLRSSRGVGITDPRVVFHSFRHTFKTLCRAAEISEEVHDALTGHVSSSVSRRYGEMPLGPLVRAIHSIKLPVALPRIDT